MQSVQKQKKESMFSLTPIGSENGTKYGKGMEAGETIYLKVSGSNQIINRIRNRQRNSKQRKVK